MGKTLKEIVLQLTGKSKKVKLIYAFNGVGKTRLSRTFKEMISPKYEEMEDQDNDTGIKVLYYNAFTEDLFYWDNDLDEDKNRTLKIRPNSFTKWVLKEAGQDINIINEFQHYTRNKLTPHFNANFNEISFSIESGNDERIENIKISRGEESCFIWCVFFCLLREVIYVLNEPEPAMRANNQFDNLEYVFIDDPVSSLDENHLIELAVDIAELIKSSQSDLKFIIAAHNTLFYNMLYNELSSKETYMLSKNEDGTFELDEKKGDSNRCFSYHLFLKKTLEEAIESNTVQKYHFMLLRNLYEKTTNFLGYPRWSDLLPENKQTYYNRIIQFMSHSTLSDETIAEPTNAEKQTVRLLLNHLIENKYWKEKIK